MVNVSDDQVPWWETHFRAMECEWGEVSARRTTALLADWPGDISDMRRQHDRLVADSLWLTGPSDFLDIIVLAREPRQPQNTTGIDSPRSITPPPKEAPDDD